MSEDFKEACDQEWFPQNFRGKSMTTLTCARCENKLDINENLKQYFSMRCKLKIIERKKKVSKFKAEATNATNLDTVIEEYINLPFINENMIHYK
tara:strand:+ start:3429 stop:3713 length:285 start_codon:yes stop_codon:yes gene_type:complete